MTGALDAVSDRTLNRALLGLVAALVIGLPTIALVYVLDRSVDPGPSRIERAIGAAEEAVRSEPNKLSNRLALALAYAEADRPTDALAQFDEILRVEPANRAALIGRADTLFAAGNLDAAGRDYQAVVDGAATGEMANVDSKLEAAYYRLGSIALRQDRPRDAAAMLAKALRINRTDADALNLMGTALLRIDDVPNAIQALRGAIALVPSGWCEPYAQLVQAYAALPDATGVQYASGMVALCEQRPADAEAHLKPLVNGPFSRDALIGLGLTAEAQGNVEAAVGYYSRVYATNPSDFVAISGLSRLGAGVPSPSPGGDIPLGESAGD